MQCTHIGIKMGLHVRLHVAILACLCVANAAVFGNPLDEDGGQYFTRHLLGTRKCHCKGITFVSRAQWNARDPKKRQNFSSTPTYAFVHHTASGQCDSLTSCSAKMRIFQNHHMDTEDWDDIGYNFVIGGDKRVYYGRGWNCVGAHTLGKNHVSLGIAIIGDYTNVLPSKEVLDVLTKLLKCAVQKKQLTSTYTLQGHRDASATECPGDMLYAEIMTWPHYPSVE